MKQMREQNLQKIKDEQEEKERGNTFKPQTNNVSGEHKTDHNKEMFERSKEQKKEIKTYDELKFEREQSECSFKPKLEKSKVKPTQVDLNQIKGYEQMMSRLKKGRLDQVVKKTMLERSEFCPTKGISKVFQMVQEGNCIEVPVAQFNLELAASKYKSIGPKDGSQITYTNKVQPSKQRAPLYQVKTVPQAPATTKKITKGLKQKKKKLSFKSRL